MPLSFLDQERLFAAFQETLAAPPTQSSCIGEYGVFLGDRLINMEGSWSWTRRSGASNKLNRWLSHSIRVMSPYNQPVTQVRIRTIVVELNEPVPFTWNFTRAYPELTDRIKELFTIRPITQQDLMNNIHAVT